LILATVRNFFFLFHMSTFAQDWRLFAHHVFYIRKMLNSLQCWYWNGNKALLGDIEGIANFWSNK